MDIHKEYKLINKKVIDEINITLYEIKHNQTGAEILHIEADDDENLFNLSFKTYPSNNNGVAHILEHTVLCGSQKYPVKDPFFSMSRRSLNTFMNAMTGSDFTCYPASSQNKKDFYHLLDVYLDCVFYPTLNEFSFMQEGHHLEFAEKGNIQSPLQYGGIVFNEMKGSLNSADSRLWHFIHENLFPDTIYRFNSGGDPKEIPNLTYKEFKEFHKKYYHPSRCLFYFYGNIPVNEHLEFLHERVLKRSEKLSPIAPPPLQSYLKKPKQIHGTYPCNEEDLSKKTSIAFSWLTAPITNEEEVLALILLDSLLMDTDASPLRRELLKSHLCTQAFSVLDPEIAQMPFIIIAKGTEKEHLKALEEIVFSKLCEIAKKGFSQDEIEASLHQLELSRLEITGNHSPYGLSLFWRCGLMKQHGADPANGLMIHTILKKLRENLQNPDYLSSLIQRYLIDNTHFISCSFSPDPSLEEKEMNEEKEKLETLSQALTDEEKLRIIKQNQQLEIFQNTSEEEVIDCLPKLERRDIPLISHDYPLSYDTVKDIKIYAHNCFTNGLDYFSMHFPLPELTNEELQYTQLFSSILTELGAKGRSFQENLYLIQRYSGGIESKLSFHGNCDLFNEIEGEFVIRGKCLSKDKQIVFDLFEDFITSVDLTDKTRIKELILQIDTYLANRLTKSAMSYATFDSLQSFAKMHAIKHLIGGHPYYAFMHKLVINLDHHLDAIIEKFQTIQKRLFHFNQPSIVFTTAQKIHMPDLVSRLSKEEKKAYTPFIFESNNYPIVHKGYEISSPVAFNAYAIPCVGFDHYLSASMHVLSELLVNTTLHAKIREKGGAYGCGASYHPLTHCFHFYSYRDPHIVQTYHAFFDALKEINKGKFSDRNIEEAIFNVIQDIDAPLAPGSRGSLAYAWHKMNRSYDKRNAYRKQMLNCSAEEIKQSAKILMDNFEKGKFITFASEQLLVKAKDKLPIHLIGDKVIT